MKVNKNRTGNRTNIYMLRITIGVDHLNNVSTDI